MCCAIVLSRSMPFSNTMRAKAGPAAYIQIGALAPSTNSAPAQMRELGPRCPPMSSGICRRHHSESIQALYDLAKASGMVTVFSAGSYTGGLRSESSNDAARSSRARRSISERMLRAVSTSISSNGPCP
jgi:hypothetical protein